MAGTMNMAGISMTFFGEGMNALEECSKVKHNSNNSSEEKFQKLKGKQNKDRMQKFQIIQLTTVKNLNHEHL